MTREDVIKECADRLRPLGMVAMAVSFAEPNDTEQLLALGPLPRLASMSAGVLDRTQQGLFTRLRDNSDRYEALTRDAFLSPHASMSVS